MENSLKSANKSVLKELKQIKVDNWGTFFLQRLLQLYFNEELLDLTLKFPASNSELKVHRLVVTACTDYFSRLEETQIGSNTFTKNVISMPTDMPYECVKSIISFMYTGQLEYWTSEQSSLYYAAQQINMAVLTKLLDAKINSTTLKNNSTSKAVADSLKDEEASELPISNPNPPFTEERPVSGKKVNNYFNFDNYRFGKSKPECTGPSRFDLPEVEDITTGIFSSFDDITYNTKPIIQAPEILNDAKKSEDEDLIYHSMMSKKNKDIVSDEDPDWVQEGSSNKSIEETPVKKSRFDFEDTENADGQQKSVPKYQSIQTDSLNNHEKIVKEVLKKYPHLVKNNKNIRLKIMQKDCKKTDSVGGKTKVQYVALKCDSLLKDEFFSKNETSHKAESNENGPWKCDKCDLEEQYTTYYMYRRHMQDVHDEKFDPRICEHCGYKATKRNLLLYHMYTKHDVSPPKNISFPKCPTCPYIALSETLLTRHQMSHNKHKIMKQKASEESRSEIQCSQCNKFFKDVSSLATHEINSGHGNSHYSKSKGNHCPYCDKDFLQLSSLQVHISCMHKEIKKTDSHRIIISSADEESMDKAYGENYSNTLKTNDNSSNTYHKNKKTNYISGNDQGQVYENIYVQDTGGGTFETRDTDGNTIIYIQNDPYQSTDEIVEEVIEEVEQINDEEIQYVEETEIVEYDDNNTDDYAGIVTSTSSVV